jgi:hypothetical protein
MALTKPWPWVPTFRRSARRQATTAEIRCDRVEDTDSIPLIPIVALLGKTDCRPCEMTFDDYRTRRQPA